ncbi:MAG: GGDEF domain-containing protein [Pseudomonadota bacterium]
MSVTVPYAGLNELMPMHAIVAPTGQIRHVGPTLKKITGGDNLTSENFMDRFEIIRPFGVSQFSDLYEHLHSKLRVQVAGGSRKGDTLTLRGSAQRLSFDEGMLINLSWGISIVDAVQRFNLSAADFAPADPSIDMLYLIEVNNAAMAESKRLNARLQGAKLQAEMQAHTDPLTGLQNRRALDLELSRLVADDIPFALMNIDMDYFKAVNDTHGHAAGDRVLEAAAAVLKQETRSSDFVARIGGDEFIVAFENLTDIEQLLGISERVICGFERPVIVDNAVCNVSASIGFTVSTQYERPDAEMMLEDADSALYQSKRAGRSRATVFDPNAQERAVG